MTETEEDLKGAVVLSVKEGYLGEVIVKTKNNEKVRIKAGCDGGEPSIYW